MNTLGTIVKRLDKKRVLFAGNVLENNPGLIKMLISLNNLGLKIILSGIGTQKARDELLLEAKNRKIDTDGFFLAPKDKIDQVISKSLSSYTLSQVSKVSIVVFYDNGLPEELVKQVGEITHNLKTPFIYASKKKKPDIKASLKIYDNSQSGGFPSITLSKSKLSFNLDGNNKSMVLNQAYSFEDIIREAIVAMLSGYHLDEYPSFIRKSLSS